MLVLVGCGGGPATEVPQSELSGSWPQWRGPDRDGSVVDPGFGPWVDGEFTPREVWRTSLGAGFSGLAVSVRPGSVESQSVESRSVESQSRAFTTWVDGGREVLGALDAHSGDELWTVTLGDVKGSAHGDGPRSTPLVAAGVVYAMGSFGDLVAARAADGSEVWRRNLRPLAEGDEPDWAFAASPLLDETTDDARLFVHLGGPAAVLALDPQTGDTLWQTESYRGYASPVTTELAGRRQLLSLTGAGLLGLEPASGEVLWSFPRETFYGLNAADPVPLGDGRIFLSAHYNAGAALLHVSPPEPQDGEWTVVELWSSRRLRNHFATSLHWPEADLIVGFDGDFLAAVDVETGDLLWKARGTGKGQALRIETAGDGSPRLLVLSDECEVQLGTVDREGWTVAARHALDLGGTCFAVPSLVGRRLFVRDDRYAVALDLAPEAVDLAPVGS